jgi:hypothetical protein
LVKIEQAAPGTRLPRLTKSPVEPTGRMLPLMALPAVPLPGMMAPVPPYAWLDE